MRIPYLAPSLGGAESFIEQPASMSDYDKAPEELAAIGISSTDLAMEVHRLRTRDCRFRHDLVEGTAAGKPRSRRSLDPQKNALQ